MYVDNTHRQLREVVMNERQARWHRRLDQLDRASPPEPLILNEAMISQWLRDHRVEYTSTTDPLRACLEHFRLHRRHRQMVWSIYSRTDFSHLKQGGWL